jgi:hypothetical protein
MKASQHPDQKGPIPALMRRLWIQRIFSALVILSLLLSCNFITSQTQNNLQVSSSVPLAGSFQNLDLAEKALRDAVREPERKVLGDRADEFFKLADSAYQAVNQRIQEKSGAAAPRYVPVLAQTELFGLAFGLLLANLQSALAPGHENTHAESKGPLFEGVDLAFNFNTQRSASTLDGDIDITITVGKGSDSMTENVKGKFEMNVCPDSKGEVKVTYNFLIGGGANGGGSSVGYQITIQGTGTGHVNDDAVLTGLDLDATTGSSGQANIGGKTSSQNFGGQFQLQMADLDRKNIRTTANHAKVTTMSSGVTQEMAQSLLNVGAWISVGFVYSALLQAKDAWQGGFCLEIQLDNASDQNQVHPKEIKEFTARVHHKIEGGDINAPIKADFSGEKSLKPLEKTRAPVHYTYEAPAEPKKKATVKLESRSNRGVARKVITFITQPIGYYLKGKAQSLVFDNTICDPYHPFTLEAIGVTVKNSFKVPMNFIPNGESLQGTFSYRAPAGGYSIHGNGTYEILPGDGGAASIKMNVTGCIDIAGIGCGSGVFTLPLTPLPDPNACN